MLITLTRILMTAQGTWGRLHVPAVDDMPALDLPTIEAPWLDTDELGNHWRYGVPRRSCVPAGRYTLVQRLSPKYGLRWHLQGEGVAVFEAQGPGWRAMCMFHPANHTTQLKGCIAAGMSGVPGQPVNRSGAAIQRLETWLLGYDTHELVIEGSR